MVGEVFIWIGCKGRKRRNPRVEIDVVEWGDKLFKLGQKIFRARLPTSKLSRGGVDRGTSIESGSDSQVSWQ